MEKGDWKDATEKEGATQIGKKKGEWEGKQRNPKCIVFTSNGKAEAYIWYSGMVPVCNGFLILGQLLKLLNFYFLIYKNEVIQYITISMYWF